MLISPADRRLIGRLALAAGAIFVITFAISRLDLLYSHKFYDATGRAQWIWYNHRIASGDPLAFFATRDFDLPPNRYFTHIKIAADPEYTLYFNGRQIGGNRAGDRPALEMYDVTQLARTKANRIVVALRSPNGVGGLLCAVDLSDDLQNFVITDASWAMVARWTPDLPLYDPSRAFITRPLLLGIPPARRWNYLDQRAAQITDPPKIAVAPRASFTFNTALPDIEIIEGTATTVAKKTVATAYDFGPTTGRARLTLTTPTSASEAVKVRYANERSELMSIEGVVEPFVFAPGERSVIDAKVHRFRYVMVYGSLARADVVE